MFQIYGKQKGTRYVFCLDRYTASLTTIIEWEIVKWFGQQTDTIIFYFFLERKKAAVCIGEGTVFSVFGLYENKCIVYTAVFIFCCC